jgi:hypothetical protein
MSESMSREQWWDANDRGETKILGEKPAPLLLLNHKYHTDQTKRSDNEREWQ